MSLKVGQRVMTTVKTMGPNHTEYHGVIGTITDIRSNSNLPIVFKPDKNVPGEVPEWSLFEDEVVPIPEDNYWKSKYQTLRAKVDGFRYETEGM